MYIAKDFLTGYHLMPMNQGRAFANIIANINPHTNVGHVSFERMTLSMRKRLIKDIKCLVTAGIIKKYPKRRYSTEMRAKSVSMSNQCNFYMVNPEIYHEATINTESGVHKLWQLM